MSEKSASIASGQTNAVETLSSIIARLGDCPKTTEYRDFVRDSGFCRGDDTKNDRIRLADAVLLELAERLDECGATEPYWRQRTEAAEAEVERLRQSSKARNDELYNRWVAEVTKREQAEADRNACAEARRVKR